MAIDQTEAGLRAELDAVLFKISPERYVRFHGFAGELPTGEGMRRVNLEGIKQWLNIE